MPQFQALGAQVVGVSTDPAPSLAAWQKENNAGGKQILLSDFPRRQMLTAYGALETNEQSPVYRYAKRAYYIIDKTGKWEMTFVAGIALLLVGAVLAFWMKPDEELEDPADGERATRPAPVSPSTAAAH